MSEVIRFTKAWGRALEANARYTALLGDLAVRGLELLVSAASELGPQIISTNIAQEATSVTSIPPPSPAAPSPPAMVLEGEAGSHAFGLFVVENKLPKAVTTRVAVGPLVDPEGREIPSVLRFEPGIITLGPGEQAVAKVSARISRGLIAGVRYEGEISVPGITGARIPIIVRRKPSAKTTPGLPGTKRGTADAARRSRRRPPGKPQS